MRWYWWGQRPSLIEITSLWCDCSFSSTILKKIVQNSWLLIWTISCLSNTKIILPVLPNQTICTSLWLLFTHFCCIFSSFSFISRMGLGRKQTFPERKPLAVLSESSQSPLGVRRARAKKNQTTPQVLWLVKNVTFLIPKLLLRSLHSSLV